MNVWYSSDLFRPAMATFRDVVNKEKSSDLLCYRREVIYMF
jgi:hypothetical protein